jgi:hypothetical protein
VRKIRCAIGLLSCTILFSTGCGVHRGNVTALSHEQQQYYAKLEDTLKQKRQTLAIALEEQLKVDRNREQNLLDWRRDLEKAEVLLARQPNVTGADRLLHMKLAELDLESVHRVAGLRQIDDSRKNAILKLYDKVISALGPLQQNSDRLLKYLESKDATYALRNLDVEGMFRVAMTIQKGLRGRGPGAAGVCRARNREDTKPSHQYLSEVIRFRGETIPAALNNHQAQGQRNLSWQIPGWAGVMAQRNLSWQIPGWAGVMAGEMGVFARWRI